MAEIELVLCMIVKDEENQIFKTINSCKDIVKSFYILDTGSTDKTKEIIENFCKENSIKLNLQSAPFVDFSTNRNQNLFYVYENSTATHILFLDSNDILYGGKELIQYLSENPDYDGYFMTQKWEDDNNVTIKYKNYRCIRNNKKWKYTGVVHEVIVLENASNITINNPEIYIYQNRIEDNRKSNKRYKRDAELLLKEYNKNPNDTRSLYYLANTFYFMEEHKIARKYYKLRAKFDTYDEEKYQSMIRYAKSTFFLKEDWSKVEKWLWKAWNFYRDLEPVLIIARHYYDKQYFDTAYYLTKMCCDLEFRESVLHIDETMYEFKRWYLASMVANYKQDYEFGYHSSLKALESKYCKGDERKQMESNLEYYKQAVLNTKQITKSTYLKYTDKQLVLLFGGFSYYKWNGNSIHGTKGLGGSETSAVYIAENLVKLGYSVVMCCDTETYETINGVEYIKIADYEHFISTYFIDILIVLRYADYIRYSDNINSVYLWLQDVTFIGSGFIDNEKLKGIITLCEWHKLDFYQKCTMSLDNRSSYFQKIVSIGNAIITERFENINVEKIKNRFIYSSCPSRALEYLIDIWDDILNILPDATLSIFSDFDNSYVRNRISNIDSFIEKVKSKKGVEIIGRVDQKRLALEMCKSEYWLYTPFEFDETYCITALEMQAAGVTCICTKNGSLNEVVDNRGFLLNSMDKEACKREILSILSNHDKNQLEPGKEWSKTQTWENRAKEWVKLFNNKRNSVQQKIVGFYIDNPEHQSIIFNYAHYNEVILGNASIIITKHNVQKRFKNRFTVLDFKSKFDLNKKLKDYFITHFYNLKPGENDGFILNNVVNINHCYLVCNETHKHGDVYMSIKPLNEGPFVPIIVSENTNKNHLRNELSIPEDALVFGVYDCTMPHFVYTLIESILKKKGDIYFIFYDSKPLINHSNIIHLKDCEEEFINTCNALLDSGLNKQCFETNVLNFVINKKPVISFNKNEYSTYCFKDSNSLENILTNFKEDKSLILGNYNLVKEFYNPEAVMKQFNNYLLVEKRIDEKVNIFETKIKVCGNWMSNEEWCKAWNKMSKDGKGKWNNISFYPDIENPDLYLIVNKPPPNEKYIINKSIVLRMEPNQETDSFWNDWYTNKNAFLYFLEKDKYRNTGEWHLSKTYSKLQSLKVEKSNILSTIMSSEYRLEGHQTRINFLKFLQDEKGLEIDVYGKNNKFEFKNYKGSLPAYCKDLGLFPYKYTFMAENASNKNFFTEKIIDPILSETLIFYWGCPNIDDYIDNRAYILLNPNDFEESYNVIVNSINNNEWEKRVDIIRKEKLKITNYYTVFPRIEALLGVLNIKNIVITLKYKKERLELFEKRRLSADIKSYDIFEGLVGKDIDFKTVKSLFNFVPTKGEIGCAMSHFTIWKNVNQDTIVFEDDVEFCDGYIDSLSYLYQYLKINYIDFDLIFLGYHKNNSLIERMNIDFEERTKDRDNKLIFPFQELQKYRTSDEPYSFFGGGTFGYLISEKGAKRLISYTEKYGFKAAVDYHIYDSSVNGNLNIFGAMKPIVFSELATDENKVDSSTVERT